MSIVFARTQSESEGDEAIQRVYGFSWIASRNVKLAVAMTITLCFFSCSIKFTKVDNVDDTKKFLDKIKSFNHEVRQIKGLIDIRAKGLLKSFWHEEADILAQDPGLFLFSIRSFFNSPQALIAFDGECLTSLDFSKDKGTHYERVPIAQNFFSLGELSLHIEPMQSLFMAKIPLLDSSNLFFSLHESLLKITGLTRGLLEFEVLFDLSKNELKKITYKAKSKNVIYQIDFSEYEKINGISFPLKRVFHLKNHRQSITLNMLFKNVILNNDPYPKTLFYLKP